MIVSITCRHDTESEMLRRRVDVECQLLACYLPDIMKIRVVFSRESSHSVTPDLIACHISIQVPNKQHIDVYEYQPNAYLAFHRALDRASSKLMRLSVKRHSHVIDKYSAVGRGIRL